GHPPPSRQVELQGQRLADILLEAGMLDAAYLVAGTPVARKADVAFESALHHGGCVVGGVEGSSVGHILTYRRRDGRGVRLDLGRAVEEQDVEGLDIVVGA